MSIETWKKEFYPTDPIKRMREKDAILHSIRKWEGLTKENLERHDVYIHNAHLDDDYGYSFEICSNTCSLCVKYLTRHLTLINCYKCPLYKKLGFSCGRGKITDGWNKWVFDNNPDLMIKNLKSLLVD